MESARRPCGKDRDRRGVGVRLLVEGGWGRMQFTAGHGVKGKEAGAENPDNFF